MLLEISLGSYTTNKEERGEGGGGGEGGSRKGGVE